MAGAIIHPEREIFCTSCGGKAVGCKECDESGVQVVNLPPREDGLPWHLYARENPTDLHFPEVDEKPRRRAAPMPTNGNSPDSTAPATNRRRARTR